MRSNKQLNPRFIASERWSFNRGPGGEVKSIVQNEEDSTQPLTAFSHSGNERNRLFINHEGQRFSNISGISGADSVLDGRSFVQWDFNRDGRPDIAVVNANEQLLQIFENKIPQKHNFIAIRLEGGMGSGEKNEELSNRDAIGAVVTVKTNTQTLMRALSCGEGFASQNSKTLLVGLGEADKIESVSVAWPSGRVTEVKKPKTKNLILLSEAKEQELNLNYSLD